MWTTAQNIVYPWRILDERKCETIVNMVLPLRVRKHIDVYGLIAFVTGFVLMAYELAASRILAPSIGSSTYVWTSVIGVMIAALAAGYATGGWLADRRAAKLDIAWLLLACAAAVLGTYLFYDLVLLLVVRLADDARLQGVLATVLLFLPASFVLGVISPYLARLRVHSVQTAGRSVAGLSALNSIGGITGTFCTGFVFFSYIGSRETLLFLILLLLAASWLIVPWHRMLQRFIFTTFVLLFAVLQIAAPVQAASLIASIDTPSSHYEIHDAIYKGSAVRVIATGPEGMQSGVYTNGSKDLVFAYAKKLAEAVAAAPHHERILVLGGGAFTIPEYLGRQYPQAQIDTVEIDPQLPEIARTYFRYTPLPNVRIVTQDGRIYLDRATTAYDIIVVDVYSDTSIPFSLSTQEYVQKLHQAITPNGVILANIISRLPPACSQLLASIHHSYTSQFTYNRLMQAEPLPFSTNQNIIAAYSNSRLGWLNPVAGQVSPPLAHGKALTDNYAPVEQLKQRCT